MPMQVRSLAEWLAAGIPQMLSVVIPAHNEEGHIADTVKGVVAALTGAGITHEVLVINDNSVDGTESVLKRLAGEFPTVRYVNNEPPNGFGFAVRRGIADFRGDVVAIMMADGSDSEVDLVTFYRKLNEGYDCVFGSRFMRGSKVIDYPWPKLILNRLGNTFIRTLFLIRNNDVSNAFKMYRRAVIAGVQPIISHHFNLTIELPLKAIARGYTHATVPNTWRNRKEGISKFKIKEMGSRYFFVVFYCFIEMKLSRDDYKNTERFWGTQLQVWHR